MISGAAPFFTLHSSHKELRLFALPSRGEGPGWVYVFYLMNIQISNLKKTFGEKTAVDIASFTIHQGDILGLVGNNGAGKTTLFRLILDLMKADEGKVTLVIR